jgi:hypothetical protein
VCEDADVPLANVLAVSHEPPHCVSDRVLESDVDLDNMLGRRQLEKQTPAQTRVLDGDRLDRVAMTKPIIDVRIDGKAQRSRAFGSALDPISRALDERVDGLDKLVGGPAACVWNVALDPAEPRRNDRGLSSPDRVRELYLTTRGPHA